MNTIKKSTINTIKDIEQVIEQNHSIFTSMGVTNGLAGVSLFYFYENKINLCLAYLEKAIEGLNESYKGSYIIEDIISIGKLLNFYKEKGILNASDIEFYFENYDSIIEDFLVDSLKEDNLSPISGTLKYVNYFINRMKHSNKDYQCLFSDVLDKIEELSQKDEVSQGIFWTSNIERQGRKVIELGIKHGVMGITDSLISFYEIGFEKDRVKRLIEKALMFITDQKLTNEMFLFPFSTNSDTDNSFSSFNILYGDLGIAYGFYRAGKICAIKEYENLAIEILSHASHIRDDKQQLVSDANLFYGSLGIASFMQLFQKKANLTFLEETIAYWYKQTENYRTENPKWAGFDTTFNKFDVNAQLSFSHGIVGIGIALLNFDKNLDFEFLSFIDYEL
ncbi:conserved hypothetical protein [Flavobacterium sp. 9AF]|uniref:lanthionine synthetase LanC family protein n=1 Tax=Flavobacterium sp. 9AF TaxID=2653142 RepID=UPI0012F0FE55|nr:lanthionine synthetase LanC family protein [Flavobacterium sp. 9AF]VXB33546.1 conserved hypothetical protein [Flavobacterium sp. 9AF]